MDDKTEVQFKYYDPDKLTTLQAITMLRDLTLFERSQVLTSNVGWEMRSESAAEAKGITVWASYDKKEYCQKVNHHSRTLFVKTSIGWIHHCCAAGLKIPRLPNTYIEPTPAQIEEVYASRTLELETLIHQKRSAANAKGNETKLLMKAAYVAERIAAKATSKERKNALRTAKRKNRTPEEVALAKAIRKQKQEEKKLLVSLQIGSMPT